MAVGTLRRRLFVDNYRLRVDHARLLVAFAGSHACVAALQGEMRAGIMVEGRRHTALRIMTVCTRRFSGLGELGVMGVFVAISALGAAVRPQQREFGLGMVEATHLDP